MVTINWPISWIESTFTSRAKTEELLRPELDRSLLQIDFEKALDFFPTSQTGRWSDLGGTIAVACCGIFLFKPKWPITRITTWGVLAGGVGGTIRGEYTKIRRHAVFVKSLEDRNGFMVSLSNVRLRESMAVGTEQEAVGSLEGGQSSTESTSTRTDTSPHSRWDEIRAANTRNAAQHSSWDALRQNHERNQVARTDDAYSSTESDRAQEQARFDAMLEAERRRSLS
ncbi:hypothetical protein PILCRDRAFT_817326 [Piloderma croceum F 1598]|uniref:Uncharacterized protein n=1 Tax=Piloderma croceum (strain F 1598) TaxID=765440 RepID=A0A0C3C6N1_PILCF|nr:hypothetical protein PILCRDRAFT_817326 [Piloderma croceum F 1598]